jgi:hypothetical protein
LTFDALAAVWGSPLVGDGKGIGDEDGDVIVLQAGKTMKKLAEVNMGTRSTARRCRRTVSSIS